MKVIYDYEVMISALEFKKFDYRREVNVVVFDSRIGKQDQIKWFCGWQNGIARITRINGKQYAIKRVRQ